MQLEIDSANRGGLVAFFEGTVVFIPFSRIPKEAGAIVTPEVCPAVLVTSFTRFRPREFVTGPEVCLCQRARGLHVMCSCRGTDWAAG